eukprot:13551040-Alexandrium_andersonii.AAC.1
MSASAVPSTTEVRQTFLAAGGPRSSPRLEARRFLSVATTSARKWGSWVWAMGARGALRAGPEAPGYS